MRQCFVCFYVCAYRPVEGPVSKFRRQLDAEDLEQTADLVLKVNALIEDRSATAEQHANVMTLHALNVHRASPAAAQQLGDTTCVMFVGLVAHRRERCFDLLCLHADDIKVCCLQVVGQMLRKCSRLKTDEIDDAFEFIEIGDDLQVREVRLPLLVSVSSLLLRFG